MQDEHLSYDAAREQLNGYEAIPYVEDGEHKATLLKQNAEVHFAIYKKYRGVGQVTRRRIREFLLPILEKEGFLVTKLGTRDSDVFIKKLGFKQIGTSSGGQRIYMLTEIRFLEKRT